MGWRIWQDLRYGLRQLWLSPGFAAVAVLSLALGIGANTAIFQLVDAVHLRSLPVWRPQELAYIDWAKGSMRSGWFSSRSGRFTYAQWDQLRNTQQAFSGLAAWSAKRFNLSTGGESRYADGLFVNGDFFHTLGVKPVLGRILNADDDRLGCGNPPAVISYGFWQREFAGGEDVIGRTVTLDGRFFPVAGVTSRVFFGVEVGRRFEVAVPLCADSLLAESGGRIPNRSAWWIAAMGRLKPGWTVERAQAHIRAISPGFTEATLPPTFRPDDAKRYLANKLDVTSGETGVSGLRRQSPLWMLLVTTGLVLLIACANLANLLLARASVREREIAVRLAIGASRGRLIAQLLAESLLIAVAGTALGVLAAQALSRGMVAFLFRPSDPIFVDLGMDWRMLGFTAAIAVGTCQLFGLLPALRATRIAPASAMRAGGRGLTADRGRFGLRRGLVVAQVSLSLVLLVGALLFVRSLSNLLAADPGFRTEGLAAMNVDLRQAHFSKERLAGVHRELIERLNSRPGIVSAAEVLLSPLSGGGWDENTWAEGSTRRVDCYYNAISPGFFKTMGVGLVSGRDLDDRDVEGSAKVAVISEKFAHDIFGSDNPLGRLFRTQGPAGQADPMYQVVGVVRNTKYYAVRDDFIPVAFFPLVQSGPAGTGGSFVVRSGLPWADTLRTLTAAVAEVNGSIGLEFQSLPARINESLLSDRLLAMLAGAFGFLAGMLATLGIYGVISYMVATRSQEIGIRVALGADRPRVLWLVLREAALLLGVGIVAGTALALWGGKAATAMLFGVKPYDPLTFGAAVLLLGGVALAASYWPARRASRLEPMLALRQD